MRGLVIPAALLCLAQAAVAQGPTATSGSPVGLTCAITVWQPAATAARFAAATITVENLSRSDVAGEMHGEFVLTPGGNERSAFKAYLHPLTGARIEPYITRLMSAGGGPGPAFMPFVKRAPFRLLKGRRSANKVDLGGARWYDDATLIPFAAIPAGTYTLSFRIVGLSGNGRDAVESNRVDVVLR